MPSLVAPPGGDASAVSLNDRFLVSQGTSDRSATLTQIQTALTGKADASHTQAISTVTGLQAALDAKPSTTAMTTAISAAQAASALQPEKSTTGAIALTKATHQYAEVCLSVAGATISFDAAAEGNGFNFLLRNRTGSAWTVPTFNGAANEYDLGATHTQVKSGGNATFTVYTRNGSMRVEIMGATQ